MCGIYGGAKPGGLNPDVLGRMSRVQKHRGPDDKGSYFHNNIALGIRRLSIIDIDSGHQPIRNERGNIWVVCNGEIYNYLELKNSLLKKGHTFYTKSDTEVLVHLYEEKGEEMVHDLNGMYAFALYDQNLERILIVRDRMGIKPLYYYYKNGEFYFASELKSILAIPHVSKDLDYDSLSTYLEIMYIPSPNTPFSEIKKLRSGSYINLQDGKLSEKAYWSLEVPEHFNDQSLSEWSNELIELIEDSSRLQLRSDVPLGSFLSGGIDSSCVTSFAAKESSHKISTFNVYWEDAKDKMDERPYAKLVSDKFDTDHYVLGINGNEVPMILEKLIWHLEEPFADAAFIPTYLISKWASTSVKVLLNGAGGDELFGGYPRYSTSYELRRLKNIIDWGLHWKNWIWSYYENIMVGKRNDWKIIYPFYKESARKDDIERNFVQNKNKSVANAMMLNDLMVYLQDNILFLLDKMTMAASIEGRVPLLDHRIVEKSIQIPDSIKIRKGENKYLFKKTLEPLLPREILYRRKDGFGAPIWNWIDKYKNSDFDQILSNGNLAKNGLINSKVINKNFIDKKILRKNDYWNYWKILILELWYKVMIVDDQ